MSAIYAETGEAFYQRKASPVFCYNFFINR